MYYSMFVLGAHLFLFVLGGIGECAAVEHILDERFERQRLRSPALRQ